MTQTKLYIYQGVNGTVQTPVLLEGINHLTKVRLEAGTGKSLTKDNIHFVSTMVIPEAEVKLWSEVVTPAGQ